MAFDTLQEKIAQAFKKLGGKKLTEENISSMLKEVRMALFEADVNYQVVKKFINDVKEEVLKLDTSTSLNPSQAVLKVVHEQLIKLLGEQEKLLAENFSGLSKVMIVGLQGSGKTTSLAKIAYYLKNKKAKKVLLVALDLQRKAAIKQLQVLAEAINVECYSDESKSVYEIAKDALEYARINRFDTILFDTAGRLHVDEALMEELQKLAELIHPDEILLSVDSMSGQEIVKVATSFNELLKISGLVVTKFDGDSRGGGVLSVVSVTGIPVKFLGIGEKVDQFDVFYPKRMADRILGMGDIESLLEMAQDKIDAKSSEQAVSKLMKGTFNLEDMLEQLQQMKKMGPLSNMLKMIPGMNKLANQFSDEDAKNKLKKQEAIILSMTKEERKNPNIIKSSRKNRIAKGCGLSTTDVNRLLKQFEQTKTAMTQLLRRR